MRYPPFGGGGGYSAIPCDTLKNVDAIGIAIPYSVIGGGGGRNVGPLRLRIWQESQNNWSDSKVTRTWPFQGPRESDSKWLKIWLLSQRKVTFGVILEPPVLGLWQGHVWVVENLSAPKSQRFLRFAIAMPIVDPWQRFPRQAEQCYIAI